MQNNAPKSNVSSHLGNYIGANGQKLAGNELRRDQRQAREGGSGEEGRGGDEQRGDAGSEGVNRENIDENKQKDENEEPDSIRQQIAKARRAMDLKEQMGKLASKAMAPARMGTSRALCWAWGVLIPSWGISLLYINLHVLFNSIFGESLFCNLGDEWIPPKAQNAGSETAEQAGKMIGIVEKIVLLFFDILALIFGGAVLSFFIMIITWMEATMWEKTKIIWGGGVESITILLKLFN